MDGFRRIGACSVTMPFDGVHACAHLAQSAPEVVVAHTFAESFLHAWHYDAQQRGVVQSHGSHVPRLEKGIALIRPNQGPLASITHQNKDETG